MAHPITCVLASSGNGESSRQFAPWTIEQTVKMSTYMFPSPKVDHLNRNSEIGKKVPPLGNGKSARVSRQDQNLKKCGTRKLLLSFAVSDSFQLKQAPLAGAYGSPDADVRCTS